MLVDEIIAPESWLFIIEVGAGMRVGVPCACLLSLRGDECIELTVDWVALDSLLDATGVGVPGLEYDLDLEDRKSVV